MQHPIAIQGYEMPNYKFSQRVLRLFGYVNIAEETHFPELESMPEALPANWTVLKLPEWRVQIHWKAFS